MLGSLGPEGQEFRKIIEGKGRYADKTGYLPRLVREGGGFLLSRPRGFGKSLLLDALGCLLSGEDALFKGLFVEKELGSLPRMRVIHLRMSEIAADPQGLGIGLQKSMGALLGKEGTFASEAYPSGLASETLESLASDSALKLALLVDDYDTPISDHFDKPSLRDANARILSGFYTELTGKIGSLVGLAFFAGATRVALPQEPLAALRDISFLGEFGAVCGFLRQEMDLLFSDLYPGVSQRATQRPSQMPSQRPNISPKDGSGQGPGDIGADIMRWYGGYSFDGLHKVANPLSVLSFFKNNAFQEYFGQTALLDSLIATIIERGVSLREGFATDFKKMGADELRTADPFDYVASLYQNGFLTLDTEEAKGDGLWSLKVPNQEIRNIIEGKTSLR